METQVHGTLVEVLGMGSLILGASGIGKSETALELVTRGHSLVSDDVVRIRREANGALRGTAPEIIRHHLEIRGIGILYIPDLYGPDSVRDTATIELVCRLERWREGEEYERLGLTRASERILEVDVPRVLLPVRPAASMSTLIEVAVREHRMRRVGIVAASRLDERVRHEARRT